MERTSTLSLCRNLWVPDMLLSVVTMAQQYTLPLGCFIRSCSSELNCALKRNLSTNVVSINYRGRFCTPCRNICGPRLDASRFVLQIMTLCCNQKFCNAFAFSRRMCWSTAIQEHHRPRHGFTRIVSLQALDLWRNTCLAVRCDKEGFGESKRYRQAWIRRI